MENKNKDIYGYIDTLGAEGLELWQHLVEKETFSQDKKAIDELAEHLDTYCSALGFSTKVHYFDNAGAGFTAETTKGKRPGVLLMGHLDTVHPKGTFNPVFRRENGYVYGPGVYDCKGGVAVNILAMKALKNFGFTDRQLKLVLVGDEEVAHTLSQGKSVELYTENLEEFAAGFNAESAFMDDSIVTGRKGGAIIKVKIEGVAAHSGRDITKGASAIREAARQILALEALTDPKGTVYNCGKITGGTGANVVADSCEYAIGLRYCTNEAYIEALKAIEKITTKDAFPRTSSEFVVAGRFPAMEPTPEIDSLFHVYRQAAKELGLNITSAVYSGGCSDAAFVAEKGLPVLCCTGVKGEANHTKEERAVESSLLERTKILVRTILELPEEL